MVKNAKAYPIQFTLVFFLLCFVLTSQPAVPAPNIANHHKWFKVFFTGEEAASVLSTLNSETTENMYFRGFSLCKDWNYTLG